MESAEISAIYGSYSRLASRLWDECPELRNVHAALVSEILHAGLRATVNGKPVDRDYHESVIQPYIVQFVREAVRESILRGLFAFYVVWTKHSKVKIEPIPVVISGAAFVPVRDERGVWIPRFNARDTRRTSFECIDPKDCVVVILTEPGADGAINSRAMAAMPWHLMRHQYLAYDQTAMRGAAVPQGYTSRKTVGREDPYGDASYQAMRQPQPPPPAHGRPPYTKLDLIKDIDKTVEETGTFVRPMTRLMLESASALQARGSITLKTLLPNTQVSYAPAPPMRSSMGDLLEHISTQLCTALGLPELSPHARSHSGDRRQGRAQADTSSSERLRKVAEEYRVCIESGLRVYGELHAECYRRKALSATRRYLDKGSALLKKREDLAKKIAERSTLHPSYDWKTHPRNPDKKKEKKKKPAGEDSDSDTDDPDKAAKDDPKRSTKGAAKDTAKSRKAAEKKAKQAQKEEERSDKETRDKGLARLQARYTLLTEAMKHLHEHIRTLEVIPILRVIFKRAVDPELIETMLPHLTKEAQRDVLADMMGVDVEMISVDSDLVRGIDAMKRAEVALKRDELKLRERELEWRMSMGQKALPAAK